MNPSKEALKELIDFLKSAKGFKTQGELSLDAGYAEQTLTQALAKKDRFKSTIDSLKIVYRDLLKNTKWDDQPDNPKERLIKLRNGAKERGQTTVQIFETAPVHAGFKKPIREEYEHQVPDYVLKIPQFRDCTYGTRASGDSMYPEIRNGDLVICRELETNARIIYGDIYIVHTDELETIKYIQPCEKGDDWVLLEPHKKGEGRATPIPRNEIRRLFKVRAIFKAY